MSINPSLLEILACPDCKGVLICDPQRRVLTCRLCKVAYPINDRDVPLLLVDEAIPLSDSDTAS